MPGIEKYRACTSTSDTRAVTEMNSQKNGVPAAPQTPNQKQLEGAHIVPPGADADLDTFGGDEMTAPTGSTAASEPPMQHTKEGAPSAAEDVKRYRSATSCCHQYRFHKSPLRYAARGSVQCLHEFQGLRQPNWNAKFVINGFPDYPEENAYYCPSSLIGESRTLDHFAALHVVVLMT